MQEISNIVLHHKHIPTTASWIPKFVLTYLKNAWYWSSYILEMLG